MREFFRGWKRKLGIATLVMACVLTAGWVRSATTHDRVLLRLNDRTRLQLTSNASKIHWLIAQEGPHPRGAWQSRIWESVSHERKFDALALIFDWPIVWASIYDGDNVEMFSRSNYCEISYWLIAIPLILLSARLLLSKPRHTAKVNA